MAEILEAALKAGEVGPVGGGRYRCKVCDIQYASKATIRNHLSTKRHREKLSSRPPSTFTSCVADSESQKYSSEQPQRKESAAKMLERALQIGHVTPVGGGAYWCELCERQCASKATVKAHLTSNKHSEKVKLMSRPSAKTTDVAGSEPLNPPSLQLKTQRPVKAYSSDVQRESLLGSSDQKVKDTSECESSEEVLKAAMQAGQVSPVEGGRYRCEVCEWVYTSKATVKKHLSTKRHRDKAGLTPGRTRDGRPLPLGGPGCCLPPGTEDLPDRATFRDQAQDDGETPARLTGLAQGRQSDIEYPYNKELPPGRVYVFNYIYFHHNTRQKIEDRMGAKRDSINLQSTFKNMGYQVRLHEDLTVEQTMREMDDIKNDRSLESIQALFFFFLSHGTNSMEFLAADGKILNVDRLRNEFTNDKCPALARKPKIFMTNFCRGKNEERVETDGRVAVPRDIVTIYASSDGIAAYRLPAEGTSFVLSLCHVLRGLRQRTELRHVYHLLTQEMRERQATSPTWEDFSFKEYYLEIPMATDGVEETDDDSDHYTDDTDNTSSSDFTS